MNAPVHVVTVSRDETDWRRITLTISPEIRMTGDPGTDLQAIVTELESRIIAHPDHWWGWSGIERGTREYHERYRRQKERARTASGSKGKEGPASI